VRPQAADERRVGWRIGAGAIEELTSASVFGDGAELDVTGGRAETALLIQVARAEPAPCAVVGVALVFDRAAVIGRACAGGLPAAACARLWIDGELRESAPVTTDVAATIAHVAAAGKRLRAGDLILAGSLTRVPVRPGSTVIAEIDGIGRVEAALMPARRHAGIA
jgi:hypothetical protein